MSEQVTTRTSAHAGDPGADHPGAADAGAVDAGAADPDAAHEALLDRDRRAAERFRRAVLVGRVAVVLVFLGAWEMASGRWVSSFYLSSPSAVAERLVDLVVTGELWPHAVQTIVEVALGMAIGIPLGVALGLALGFSELLAGWLLPYVMALYSLPRVALAPLFIVWFGIGLASKITMVVTMVLFVIFYNVHQGARGMDPDLLDVARSLRASRWQTARWVVLPSLTPWLITALRLSIGIALIGAVIAEMVAASAGLGYYIKYSSGLLDVTGVFAGLAVITLLAVAMDQLLRRLERRVARHH